MQQLYVRVQECETLEELNQSVFDFHVVQFEVLHFLGQRLGHVVVVAEHIRQTAKHGLRGKSETLATLFQRVLDSQNARVSDLGELCNAPFQRLQHGLAIIPGPALQLALLEHEYGGFLFRGFLESTIDFPEQPWWTRGRK